MPAKKMIGRYQIRKELGRGGMATVYKAYDPTFSREVALKVLPRELLHNAQFHKRFTREAKTVAKLEHAAIVPVYDVGEDDGQPFFVMRMMTGGSLADRIQKGPLSLEETSVILARIAAGLDYAHKKGVVHRDLKPANILFDDAGEPFLSDFGIAKIANASQQTKLTGSGSIVGTAAYMSPEQAQGGEVDYRSDIYALGVMMYEMLSGKLPFESNTPMGVAIKHITDPVPRILAIKPDLPETVQAVVDKSLAKDPEARYPSASSFAEAFRDVLDGKNPNLAAVALSPTVANDRLRETRVSQGSADEAAGAGEKPKLAIPPKFLFAGLGVLVLAVVLGAVSLLARPETPVVAESPSETAVPVSPTVAATVQPPSPTPEPEPAAPTIPGGADLAAFVTANDIWVLDLIGGKAPVQLTTNRREKILMEWLPNGEEILYREGRCLYTMQFDERNPREVLCLQASEIEGASVSPDLSQLAVTVDRVLFILPFDREALPGLKDRASIAESAICTYGQVAAKSIRWNPEGNGLAVSYVALTGSGRKDVIRILDVSNCAESAPVALLDVAPDVLLDAGGAENLSIPAFDWDGGSQVLFNTFRRNDGYGELYLYDSASREVRRLNPIEGVCCYRDARFSPDGSYLIFSFQDERDGLEARTSLYYIPLEDALQGGQSFEPLSLPVDLLRIAREKPMLILRPVVETP